MQRRYVAFLRGINVGGHTVKREQFLAPFAEVGFEGVETFLASGNVIATIDTPAAPAELEGRLERALRAALGFGVATFLRTDAQVAAVVADDPFAGIAQDATHATHVTFLRSPPAVAIRDAVTSSGNDEDRLVFRGRELYWLRHGRMTDSTLTAAQLRALSFGGAATARNMTTLRRLAAKYPPGS